MKTADTNKKKVTYACIDPALNKYEDAVIFPKKLALAKENIKKSNLITFLKKLVKQPIEDNK